MVRRAVTGHGPDGRSTFVSVDDVPEGVVWQGRFGALEELARIDPTVPLEARLQGPDSGYTVQITSFPPHAVMAPLYASGSVPLHDERGFHRTDTVDVVVVMDGEVVAEMEDGSTVTLSPGDCLVQRGTSHAWRNPGDRPVRMLAVMLNDRPAPVTAEEDA